MVPTVRGADEPRRVPATVTAGLFLAWAANDIEELLTMGPWTRWHAARLREVLPVRPPWGPDGMSEKHVRLSVGIVDVGILAASADGVRTSGRSTFFQSTLWGFGIHGITHLLASAAWRGYTPGVVTARTVVLTYSVWALRRLHRAGVLAGGTSTKTWGVSPSGYRPHCSASTL